MNGVDTLELFLVTHGPMAHCYKDSMLRVQLQAVAIAMSHSKVQLQLQDQQILPLTRNPTFALCFFLLLLLSVFVFHFLIFFTFFLTFFIYSSLQISSTHSSCILIVQRTSTTKSGRPSVPGEITATAQFHEAFVSTNQKSQRL